MDTDTTNSVDGSDTSDLDTAANDTGVDAGDQQADEPQYDDDGNVIEPDEEVELDDLKLTVPKATAAKLKELQEGNLRQADYTRKTQEVADMRKAVEAERQTLHQSSQAELGAFAAATNLGAQLAQYQQVDWAAWHQSDPFAAAQATSEYTMLRDQHQQALNQLSNLRGQRLSAAQQDTAKRIEEGKAALTREVPGWNDTLKATLIGFAGEYGFSRAELDDLEADPRVAKVLHDAFKGKQATGQAKKVQGHLAAQAAQPAAKVGTAKAPVSGLDDRLSADEWMRRRNAQVRKRA